MNVSLISIHLTALLCTPAIQCSSLSKKTFYLISQSSFSKFHDSFINVNSKSFLVQTIKCNFNKFLNTAIYIVSSDHFILNENYYNYHEYFSIGQLKVDGCSFKSCRSRGSSGGAIFSICPTVIINSYFYYCFADSGGAFCIFADVNLTNTKFQRCSAINGGGFYGKFGDFCINSSSLSFCTSSVSGGGINYIESENQVINNLNISYCSSDSHSSTIYFSGRSSLIFNSIFSFCKSINGIGGICIYSQHHGIVFKMNNCYFSRMKAKEKATSIYIYDLLHFSKSDFLVSNCYFYKCSEKNIINSVHFPRTSSCLLTGCVFSSSNDVEIGRLINSDDNCFDCDAKNFDFNKIPKRKFFFIPHPYIMSMDYVLEFVNSIKLSIMFSVYTSFLILFIYEIILVFKKVKMHNN